MLVHLTHGPFLCLSPYLSPFFSFKTSESKQRSQETKLVPMQLHVGQKLSLSPPLRTIKGLFTKDTETTRRTSCRISGLNQTNAPEEEDDEEDENGSRELNSSLCSADVCDWSMTQCRSHCLQFPPEQHRCTWARCVSSISSIPHVVERQCNRCPGSTHLSLTSSSIAGIWPAALTVM